MKKTVIIAEAGVNHNGDLNLAKELIIVAKESGADFVKFQTALNCTSKYAPMASYQKKNIGQNMTQLEMAKNLRLTFDQHSELYEYCCKIGINYLSTPFDIDSINFLKKFDLPFWKVPSGEITNLPYLIEIGKTRKPVIMSTGMASLNEIGDAISILKKEGTENLTILQCHTDYPTLYRDINLKAMDTLKRAFSLPVGLSDHSIGIDIPIAAVALGAEVIEKHFTLDKNLPGPDHKASILPNELKNMITSIRNVELAMGSSEKFCTNEEEKNKIVARKSIVAKTSIEKGETLSVENITTKRPGNGITPMRWFEVLGTKAVRDFQEDELICL